MTEQLLLCGLNREQRAAYEGGRVLHLHGPAKNVRLDLNDVRVHYWDIEPPLLTDLVELATYVFAADCAVGRGGKTFRKMGEDWRRRFHLVVAVREPGQWSEPGLLHVLRETLEFLSGDSWTFDFVGNENAPPLQDYLRPGPERSPEQQDGTIVLFSGGLDSFAGAVQELSRHSGHLTLVSRNYFSGIDQRQAELAAELKRMYGDRVSHVPVEAGLKRSSRIVEHTQRTRSFLLAAIAGVTAFLEGANRICFYENGIMSINLPISAQVVQTRASRSTHPRSLMLLQQLLHEVTGRSLSIENPFFWLTKAETLNVISSEEERDLIRRTVSCSRTRDFTIAKPHCGTCAQCLQRRISTLAAGVADLDPLLGYEVELLSGPRSEGEERTMAIDMVRSAFEYRRLNTEGLAQRFVDEIGWLAIGLPNLAPSEVARRFVELFHRYGDEVRNIFVEAFRTQPEAVVDRSFPSSSLLAFVARSNDLHISDAEINTSSVSIQKVADDNTAEQPRLEVGEFRIAIDQARKRIMIEDLASVTGSTEYRVMLALIAHRKQEIAAGVAPENFAGIPGDELVDRLGHVSTEDNVRQAVSRIRRGIADGVRQLSLSKVQGLAFIETLPRKRGYRLGIKVRILDLGQIRN